MTTIETLRSRPGYIGVREASGLIGVSRYTLLDWIGAGKMPAVKIGNALKIDRADLAAWLETRKLS